MIAQVLNRYGKPARIEAHPISYRTASDNVYVLTQAKGVKIDQIMALEKEIEQVLTATRNAEVQVRWVTQGRFALVVPRPDPQSISLREMLEGISPGQPVVTLGEHYQHSFVPYGQEARSPSWLRFDLSAASTPHLLTAGTTGSGKTTLMKAMTLSLAVASDPTETAIILIDPKVVKGFLGLSGLPHLAHPVVTDAEEAEAMLAAVVEEVDRRKAESARLGGRAGDWVRLVVVIDELSALIAERPNVVEHFKHITKEGRGLLVHVVGGTQKPSKEYLSAEAVANIPARVVGLVSDKNEGYYATGVPGNELGAHKLPGAGSFFFTLNGSKVWSFQAPNVDPEEEPRIVKAVTGWWGGRHTSLAIHPLARSVSSGESGRTASQPAIATQDERDRRRDEMAAFIESVAAAEGSPPSAHRLRQEYHQRYGVGLNANTAQRLLQETVNQLHEYRGAS